LRIINRAVPILILLLILLKIFSQNPTRANQIEVMIGEKGYSISLNEVDNYLEENERLIDFSLGDIDSDGDEEVLVLTGDKEDSYGKEIIIYDISFINNKLNLEVIYRNEIGLVKPWKIETCEIDGDGQLDIFIAVNKSTQYYKEVDNRPFFFNLKDGVLVKKWTGSRVRQPFKDVYFGDINGNGSDEFIVIERVNDKGYVIAVYYWFGFGFILQGESSIYQEIGSLEVKGANGDSFIQARVKDGHNYRLIILETSSEKTENGIYLLRERGL